MQWVWSHCPQEKTQPFLKEYENNGKLDVDMND